VALHAWSLASIVQMQPQQFRRDYWGRRPLHVIRQHRSHYDDLVALSDVERYLSQSEIFSRGFVTTPRHGYGMPEPAPRSMAEVFERLSEGSSLRIRKMECFLDPDSPLVSLTRNMVQELQHPLESISCYVARAGAAGLGPHHDETEIFTLQISGSKRWRIYQRVSSASSGTHDPEGLGTPSCELNLKAGDLLYLPSGWVHDVSAEEASFSVTLVFDAFRWASLLDVLSSKLSSAEAFLQALPAGSLLTQDTTSLEEELELRRALMRQAVEAITAQDLVDVLASRLVGGMIWPLREQMQAVLAGGPLTADTLVERNAAVSCHALHTDGAVLVTLPGGYQLRMSERVGPALQNIISSTAPFRIGEILDCLSEPAKLRLAQKLLECGLLRLVKCVRND
jgi:ribosomal protein L16 Arg81 hydroxylase